LSFWRLVVQITRAVATDLSNRQVKQGCLTVAVGFRMCVRVCELNIDALLVDGLAGLQDYTLLFG
jgi:hypothetical protein